MTRKITCLCAACDKSGADEKYFAEFQGVGSGTCPNCSDFNSQKFTLSLSPPCAWEKGATGTPCSMGNMLLTFALASDDTVTATFSMGGIYFKRTGLADCWNVGTLTRDTGSSLLCDFSSATVKITPESTSSMTQANYGGLDCANWQACLQPCVGVPLGAVNWFCCDVSDECDWAACWQMA